MNYRNNNNFCDSAYDLSPQANKKNGKYWKIFLKFYRTVTVI